MIICSLLRVWEIHLNCLKNWRELNHDKIDICEKLVERESSNLYWFSSKLSKMYEIHENEPMFRDIFVENGAHV